MKFNCLTHHLLLTCQDGKSIIRFQYSWYNTFTWLTGYDIKNKINCFTCVIFGGEKKWSVNGLSPIKRIFKKIRKNIK